MTTLLDLLATMRGLGGRESLRFHNGYRTWRWTYKQLLDHSGGFAERLDGLEISKGDRVLIWCENRLGWASVFWGLIARGAVAVPVDYRSSGDLVRRIQAEVSARLLVFGGEVDADAFDLPKMPMREVEALTTGRDWEPAGVSPDDIVEIVYTSGTTGEPKGVVHRHRNICANLTPIGRGIDPYRGWMRPFQPIRLLDMLPLSHMFGQSLGLFIPPMIGGSAVFSSEIAPGAVADTIREQRVSVLVAVPKLAQNLENDVQRKFAIEPRPSRFRGVPAIAGRWWRYRKIHRRFGWKFWALVVGGAQVDPRIEEFWARLGFAVVQGYGLTETSPVVALNHPFRPKRGSIGKALPGQEVALADDGEILVRGESVVTEYFARPEGSEKFRNGWLHTGDIGARDAEGNIYFKGRKKEIIVTPDGMNVFPEDVEAALAELPEVRECAVVPMDRGGEQVHAVMVLRDEHASPELLVQRANRKLDAHQRIRSWSLWHGPGLPRTASTMKLRRGEIAAAVASGEAQPGGLAAAPVAAGPRSVVAEVLGRDVGRAPAGVRLAEDLGLTSLERVELLSRIERRYGVELDETQFAALATVGDVEAYVSEVDSTASKAPRPEQRAANGDAQALAEEPSRPRHARPAAPDWLARPRWARTAPVRWLRAAMLDLFVLPMVRELVRLKVEGIEHLNAIEPPVIFAANHASHFDTAAVLAALPRGWRRRLAPAMSQDYFRAVFEPSATAGGRPSALGQFLLACGLFNAYPLPRKLGGTRRALRYSGELADHGYCPLIFPEGFRTPDGLIHEFQGGVGLMASRLGVVVVPVHIEGMFEAYSVHHRWPREGRVRVRFGAALEVLPGEDSISFAARVERAVRELSLSD